MGGRRPSGAIPGAGQGRGVNSADEWMARAREDREEQERLIRELRALGFDACSDMEYHARGTHMQTDERSRRPRGWDRHP